ncbi:efflux RND transporter periplasmic adaptor subunit [Reichenbachiella ulvae]|uniref:Efflux RND transporter periplasmic adaptor subunit n=1 Tax=Reichenbachiella ulvae TaxID=2980104 RepID=A0ABT3CQ81_9BACT|nr:efflux RND transporter periplasmic adaptor subunit [Reichenbachiella ulvae]MCV9385620.1 efflux RND transporter periplasmic adaptor subunit [Reichenbachiella ulvae]
MRTYISIITLAVVLGACDGELEKKKAKVEELKTEISELKSEVATLEDEIKKEDPEYGKKAINKVLITALEIKPKYFEHKIDVRGGVESRTNVTVSPQIMGKIESVNVKEGQKVSKGQLLFTLDNDIIRNNIAELRTSLELATVVAEKQENLWKQNIGTEIQYLEAKNNKESLERKLATAQSQLSQSRVKAPFSGSIDKVDAKVGEMAQPGMPMVRIVNPDDIHISADVSERFIGKFKQGDKVDVYFPAQDQRLESTVTSVGQVINDQNRTFNMEVKLPKLDFPAKPNQVVVLSLKDYVNEKAIKVPTKLIQSDKIGQFIYVVEKQGEELVAKKSHIETGLSFNNETEIVSGLSTGQSVALKGYRDLSEGVIVSIEDSKETAVAAK